MQDLFGATSYDIEGGRVFALRGELDASSCRGLAEHLIGRPGSLIVVDLSQLTFMDSSGLGAVLEARRLGATLTIRNPSPRVRRILDLVLVDGIEGMTVIG